MSYESWRISFQSSEQAARSAYDEIERLRNDLADALDCKAFKGPAVLLMLVKERDTLRAQLAAAEARAERLAGALLACARKAEALKQECGTDPESAQAIQNAQYQAISTTAHIALGTIRGPEEPYVVESAALAEGEAG